MPNVGNHTRLSLKANFTAETVASITTTGANGIIIEVCSGGVIMTTDGNNPTAKLGFSLDQHTNPNRVQIPINAGTAVKLKPTIAETCIQYQLIDIAMYD